MGLLDDFTTKMAGLLRADPPSIGRLLSGIDSTKRRLADMLRNPIDSFDQLDQQAKNYNNNVVPTIQNGSLFNRPLTDEEKQQQAMNIALSVGPMGVGMLKPGTINEMSTYINKGNRGTPIDAESLPKFQDSTAPLSMVPYGQLSVNGEWSARPKEVLLDNNNGMMHFAEESPQKGYRIHRFVASKNGEPLSVMKIIEFPEKVDPTMGINRPATSTLQYAYTKEGERGLGIGSSLLDYADSRLPVAIRPDMFNTDGMLGLMRSAVRD